MIQMMLRRLQLPKEELQAAKLPERLEQVAEEFPSFLQCVLEFAFVGARFPASAE
jgi:hypothetical protein